MWTRAIVIAALLLCSACSQEEETTSSINMCAAKGSHRYTPRRLDQCVDLCMSCENGTVVTCSMACRLRGAS